MRSTQLCNIGRKPVTLHILLTHLSNVHLDGGMVLGMDDPVGCAALAWHIQVNVFSSIVLHDCGLCGLGNCTRT